MHTACEIKHGSIQFSLSLSLSLSLCVCVCVRVRVACGLAHHEQKQSQRLQLSMRPYLPRTAVLVAKRRQFGVASFVFGTESPPEDARADWEAGLELTSRGQPGEAEVAFHRALSSIDTAGYAPRSGQGRATIAAIWRDLARAQSMQSKRHEALHNLRRALATYDGLDRSTDLLEVVQHWERQSGVTGRLAKEMPRMPDGVPVQLLLNILDNLVVRTCCHCSFANVANTLFNLVGAACIEPLCTGPR